MIKPPKYNGSSVIGYNTSGELQEYVSDTEYYEDIEEKEEEE